MKFPGTPTIPIVYIEKPTSTTDNTGVLTTDLGLSYPVAAGTRWKYDLLLGVTCPSGSPGFQFGFTFPTGASVIFMGIGGPTDASAVIREVAQSQPAVVGSHAGFINVPPLGVGVGTDVMITGILQMGNTAGTFALQWAQNTINPGNPTTVGARSYMILTRLG